MSLITSGIALVGSLFTSAAITNAVIGIGLSIGLSYAAQALQKRGQAPITGNDNSAALNSPAVKYNERQAIPSKRIPYGYVQQGGALFFESVKPPYLYQGILLSAKQITAIQKMWIGTNEIFFDSLVPNTILTPIGVSGQPNYPGRLQICFRLGSATQAIDPLLHNDFPNLDASFRQQGIATAVCRYHYGGDYTEFTSLWGQVQRPNPLFLVQGVSVPDPRRAGHILNWNPNDPDSVAEAEASWSFSNNSSLVQAHYLTQRFGGRIDPGRMDWDKVAAAAEYDDDIIGCLDGTFQRRYTIDGLITLNQSPVDVISGMISANRGFVLESAGRVWVSSSKPRYPVVAIHDGILTGNVDYRAAKPKRDLVNRIKNRFIAPDREYQQVDGPVLSRTDLQSKDGEILDATLNLPFTLDDRRAQRLQKAFLESGRLGAQLVVRCDVSLLAESSEELVGSSIKFDSILFAQANGVYFVTDWGFADGFTSIDVTLTQYDPSIELNWVPNVDEQPFVLAPLDVS
ncbi:hypothetical protein [Bradyrhizobium prioriisuperbiae]|uniref:hypothetical protein n=1 Tax=Bradyrhizobium prioriisuperbiae TaxID=2854389 RepID=UPI0028F0C758|nr:hypothetical protein [Bradyrhizobium prioritasuperba]